MNPRRTAVLALLSVVVFIAIITASLAITSTPKHSTHTITAHSHSHVLAQPTPQPTTLQPTPAVVASEHVCVDLLTTISTLNWHYPTISVGTLAQWATAGFAGQLSHSYHLTLGQVQQHTDLVAKAVVDGTPATTPTQISVPIEVTYPALSPYFSHGFYTCFVIPTPAGWRVSNVQEQGK